METPLITIVELIESTGSTYSSCTSTSSGSSISEHTYFDYEKYIEDPHNNDYQEEYYAYILKKEGETLVSSDSIMENVNSTERDKTVAWMIVLQQNWAISERDFYYAVRLFDEIISKNKNYVGQYKFVAAICLCIANKQGERIRFPIASVKKLIGGDYTLSDIKQFEINVVLNFNIGSNSFDPYSILYFNFKQLELLDKMYLFYGCQTFIQTLMTCSTFSTFRPSTLAFGVLILILEFYEYSDILKAVKQIVKKDVVDMEVFEKDLKELRVRLNKKIEDNQDEHYKYSIL